MHVKATRAAVAKFLSVILLGAAVEVNAAEADKTEVAKNLLPLPQSVTTTPGTLELTKSTGLGLGTGSELVGNHFAERLRQGTGWPVPIVTNGIVRFEIATTGEKSPEAYTLQITATGVTVRAASSAGIVRGAETLLQLMPPAVYGAGKFDALKLPLVAIADAPQFKWRGAMLDVSRKFQDKATVLKLLDGLAACKLNVFHWHLTDDQGWRLPIEGYPKLTQNGPAYSRADIREVRQRAAELGITILPEIDMPGHSRASCQAYPEISTLNDQGQPSGTMNPGAAATYAFIEAVMKDVAAQFPESSYVHIGADEVGAGGWKKDVQCQALMQREKLKDTRELYVYFVNRVVAIVRQRGKKAIAWDEAFRPGADASLAIMSWRGMAPGINAAKAGRNVVFCPGPQLYFDHANTRSKMNLPAYSGSMSYLNYVYFFDAAVPAVPPEARADVLGGEGCLWGERIQNAEHMFTMMFPRACALGENLWTPRDKLDWTDFLARLNLQRQRLEAMKIPYFWDPESLAVNIGSWQPGEAAARHGVMEFPLAGKLQHAGIQEFFIARGVGNGQFRVDAAELLKDGVVVDRDEHAYESSVYSKDVCYLLKNPDTDGKYSLRLHVTPLSGDCSAVVQLNPALAAEQYSKQCDAAGAYRKQRFAH